MTKSREYAYFHLKTIRQLQNILDQKASSTSIHAFTTSQIDYWNILRDWPIRESGPVLIESIKTTSMEDVSTRVLEKIKNIQEGKTDIWSDVSRHI